MDSTETSAPVCYRHPDRELLAVLQLFRRSQRMIFQYKFEPVDKPCYEAEIDGRKVELYDDTIIALGRDGKEIFRTTVEEPLHERPDKHANTL